MRRFFQTCITASNPLSSPPCGTCLPPPAPPLWAYATSTNCGRRHEIFGQFLSLIAGAGTQHTGVKPEDFTEDMMVSLPMDNYEDLKASQRDYAAG